jgi:probable HAF family extracellular repeat protein
VTVANAVNANDQVVGMSATSGGDMHAFFWDQRRGMLDLGTLGGNTSNAMVINSKGQVAGVSTTNTAETHAFVWDPDTGIKDLGFAASTVGAINARGHVAGLGFFWSEETGVVSLPLRFGGLNDSDEMVGDYFEQVGEFVQDQAAVWHPVEGLLRLGRQHFIHGRFRTFTHINNRGEVTLRAVPNYVVWSKSAGFTIVRDPAGAALTGGEPTAITSMGDVVGPGFYWSETSGAIRVPVSGTAVANSRRLAVGGFAWSPKDGALNTGPTCGLGRVVNDNGLVLCGGSLVGYVGP